MTTTARRLGHRLQHVPAVDEGQPDVEQHHVETVTAEHLHRPRTVSSRRHPETIGAQRLHQRLAQGPVILDDRTVAPGAGSLAEVKRKLRRLRG